LSDARVLSTSQLLPLLVGIFTFTGTGWSMVIDTKESKEKMEGQCRGEEVVGVLFGRRLSLY
jgi:hypothetical protein